MKKFIQEILKWKQFLFTSNTMKEPDVDTCAHKMTMNKDHLYYRKTWIELLIIGSTWLFYRFQSDPYSMVPCLISIILNFPHHSKRFRSAKFLSRPPSFHVHQLCVFLSVVFPRQTAHMFYQVSIIYGFRSFPVILSCRASGMRIHCKSLNWPNWNFVSWIYLERDMMKHF